MSTPWAEAHKFRVHPLWWLLVMSLRAIVPANVFHVVYSSTSAEMLSAFVARAASGQFQLWAGLFAPSGSNFRVIPSYGSPACRAATAWKTNVGKSDPSQEIMSPRLNLPSHYVRACNMFHATSLCLRVRTAYCVLVLCGRRAVPASNEKSP